MMSRISHTRSTNARSRSISFGGCVGGGTTISLMIVPGDDENTYTRSPRYTASSIECVTKNTVACASFHSSTSSSCICSRVVGSSAPNGSSMRMMRGERINVRAIATRCRIPPDNSLGNFRASRFTSSPTFLIHSRACSRRWRAGTPRHSRPNATLSSTLRLSNEV